MSDSTERKADTAREAQSRSVQLEMKIRRLQALQFKAKNKEARLRCHAIFGVVPRGYCLGREERFGAVARVYVLRAHKRDDLRSKHLPDHEWIALWHAYKPTVTVKDLLEIADNYIAGGCGIAG